MKTIEKNYYKDKLSVPYLNEEIYSGSDDRLENT